MVWSLFQDNFRPHFSGDLLERWYIFRNEIAEHKRSLNEEYDRDFIDTFLKKMKEQEGLPEPAFTGTCQKSACKNLVFESFST